MHRGHIEILGQSIHSVCNIAWGRYLQLLVALPPKKRIVAEMPNGSPQRRIDVISSWRHMHLFDCVFELPRIGNHDGKIDKVFGEICSVTTSIGICQQFSGDGIAN